MKVLFVAGGNAGKFGIAPLVKAQGESLRRCGVDVSYFPIVGKGIKGYLGNVLKLRRQLRNEPVDVVHAHYSFSGIVASLAATNHPVVVSLLGSDVNSSGLINKLVIKLIPFFSWKTIIVKSEEMRRRLGKIESEIIPNGVDTDFFQPLEKARCKGELGWDQRIIHVLFAANPNRPEKNFRLSADAINWISRDDVQLQFFDNLAHKDIPVWLNAADLVLLSSLWEGSPNVIKEAMACNRPIVATNVGDIEHLFGNSPGHFVAEFSMVDFSNKIDLALKFSSKFGETSARQRIIGLGLDSESVAKRIVEVYRRVL